jgi:outer membrane murein-binding lipoprotein Lpp
LVARIKEAANAQNMSLSSCRILIEEAIRRWGNQPRRLHIMKTVLVVTLFLIIALPSFAELTQQDLDKISVLIGRKLEPIKQEITAIKLDIAEMKSKMVTKDVFYGTLILMWVTIIAAIIAIPYLYGRADRERVRQLESDVRELQKLKSEFETFKALTEAMEALREKARQVAQEKPELAEDFRIIGLL